MGFLFLPIFFASLIFNYPNGVLWNRMVVKGGQVSTYWFIIFGLAALTLGGLVMYHYLIGKRLSLSEGDDDKDS